MTTRVLLIRHAETDWNLQGRWQGHSDVPLNETGRRQARALARRLTDWPIEAIYSSDLKRARQTANILGKELNLEPVYDVVWRERNGDRLEGLTFEQLRSNFSEEWHSLQNPEMAPPGGESRISVTQRTTAAFESVIQRHEGKTTAVVTHGGTLIALISSLLGLPLGQRARIAVSGNTGLSVVEVGPQGAYLTLLNDTSHLAQSKD